MSSGDDLMSLIRRAGFKGNAANIMYAIVMAESGGNAHAHNNNASTGDDSYGLAQINMLGNMGPERLKEFGLSSYADLYDPLTNLRVAYKMSGGGTHWTDWSTYNRGEYKQYLGQSGAQVTYNGSTSVSPMDSSSSQQNTSKNYKTALGDLGVLLTKIPALRNLLQTAINTNEDPSQFLQDVQNSPWWKQHSQTAREMFALRFSDPATYQQNLSQQSDQIQHLANQLGMSLTGDEIQAIALHALLTGQGGNTDWLTQQISNHEDYSGLTNTVGLRGQMAGTVDQLQQIAGQWGINWTPAQLAQHAQSVVSGQTTIDTWQNAAINWAKSTFPSLGDQIDKGMTVQQIASPYISSMSNLLEVAPDSLNLFTPTIRRALQGTTDPSTGKRVSQNLSDFEDQVRQDPRWQYTQNAKDTMSTALVKIGADFGFGPQG